MTIDISKLGEVVDVAMHWQPRFYLPGAKEAAVKLASRQTNKHAVIEAISSSLQEYSLQSVENGPFDAWEIDP